MDFHAIWTSAIGAISLGGVVTVVKSLYQSYQEKKREEEELKEGVLNALATSVNSIPQFMEENRRLLAQNESIRKDMNSKIDKLTERVTIIELENGFLKLTNAQLLQELKECRDGKNKITN